MNINTAKYYCLAPKTAFLPDNKPSALSSGKKHDCRSAYPQNTANSFYRPLFTGSRPAVRTTVAETAKALELEQSGDEIFGKYMKNLTKKEFDNFDVYYDGTNPKPTDPIKNEIVLLKRPLPLINALDAFPEYFNMLNSTYKNIEILNGIYFQYNSNPDKFKAEIDKSFELKNIKIKGMIGTGDSSTAFLTDRNTVLKLSFKPLYPAEKDYIEDVDLPILKRFCLPVSYNTVFYGIEEPLCENNKITPLEKDKFEQIYDNLTLKIKEKSKNYFFNEDFDRSEIIDKRQIGFIKGKPYLIDRECIANRPLYRYTSS